MSSQAANRVHLQLNSSGKLEVLIASGEKLVSPGRCAQVQVRLQKVLFEIDFFILPLEGCYAVLGTQWLRTLGPIQWDFDKLLMKFSKGNKKVILRGIIDISREVFTSPPVTQITKISTLCSSTTYKQQWHQREN